MSSRSSVRYTALPQVEVADEDEVELTDYGPIVDAGRADEDEDEDEDEDVVGSGEGADGRGGGGRRRADLIVRPLSLNFTLDTTSNQRTQWAWTRTALGMISLGLSITHIFTKQSQLLGLVFILLGGVYGVVASVRYYYFFQDADAGKFRTNSVAVTVTTLFTLGGLFLVMLLMHYQGRGTTIGQPAGGDEL